MGRAIASMDLPCDWAHFMYICAEKGIEDNAIIIISIIIATWYREGPAMTQPFYMNHGRPDGDLMISLLAYQWFEDTRNNFVTTVTMETLPAIRNWLRELELA